MPEKIKKGDEILIKRYLNILFYIVILIIVVKSVFNLSFSLPTTFSKELEEDFSGDLDTLVEVEIRERTKINSKTGQISPLKDEREFHIDDTEADFLVNSDVRIYNGGWIGSSSTEYSLCLHFENDYQCYFVAEKYIIDPNHKKTKTFKVLSNKNEIYEYIESLFEQ